MADIRKMRKALIRRTFEGAGKASPSVRRSAFNNSGLVGYLSVLADKVARNAYSMTDEDFRSAKISGCSEDQIFELVLCAAIGQATRQYDSALAALEAATGRE